MKAPMLKVHQDLAFPEAPPQLLVAEDIVLHRKEEVAHKLFYGIIYLSQEVGNIQLSTSSRGINYMSYRRAPAEILKGRGIVTQSAIAVRDFAFHELGIDTIELVIGKTNSASRRLAVRLGAILTSYPAKAWSDTWTIRKEVGNE